MSGRGFWATQGPPRHLWRRRLADVLPWWKSWKGKESDGGDGRVCRDSKSNNGGRIPRASCSSSFLQRLFITPACWVVRCSALPGPGLSLLPRSRARAHILPLVPGNCRLQQGKRTTGCLISPSLGCVWDCAPTPSGSCHSQSHLFCFPCRATFSKDPGVRRTFYLISSLSPASCTYTLEKIDIHP